MPINAGKLDRRITLQTATQTRGAAGGFTSSWVDTATVWAEYMPQGGREFRAAGALHAETSVLFRIRYRAATTADMRISFGGALYDIISIAEEGRREALLIQAKTATGVTP